MMKRDGNAADIEPKMDRLIRPHAARVEGKTPASVFFPPMAALAQPRADLDVPTKFQHRAGQDLDGEPPPRQRFHHRPAATAAPLESSR